MFLLYLSCLPHCNVKTCFFVLGGGGRAFIYIYIYTCIYTHIYIYTYIYMYTLEINHHLKNGGSFWMMIFTPTKIMVTLGNQLDLKMVAKDFQGIYIYILKGILAAPPKATPPRNKGLIRPY